MAPYILIEANFTACDRFISPHFNMALPEAVMLRTLVFGSILKLKVEGVEILQSDKSVFSALSHYEA